MYAASSAVRFGVYSLTVAALVLACGTAPAQIRRRTYPPCWLPPAGKHGFLRIANGHFVQGNGERIRFCGVPLTGWSKGSVMLPPKQDSRYSRT